MAAPSGAARRSDHSSPGAPQRKRPKDRSARSVVDPANGSQNLLSLVGILALALVLVVLRLRFEFPSDEPAAPLGERVECECPGCGRPDFNAMVRMHPKFGVLVYFIRCWSANCPANELPELAELLDLPRGATKAQMVAALRKRGHNSRRRADREPLPSKSAFAGMRARLLASPGPLAYLTDVREIALGFISEAGVGCDGKGLPFPMRHDGEIGAAMRRLPRKGAQMRSYPGEGRAWPLYPEPKPQWGRVLLLAGPLDALRGRSAGLPACSVTPGVSTWRDEWIDDLRGRFVVVCFDNNEQEIALERVKALRAAGIRARRLDLRSLGLRGPKADLSDYLNGGGSALVLRRRALRRSR